MGLNLYQVMVNKMLLMVDGYLAITPFLKIQQLLDHFLQDWVAMKEQFLVLECQCRLIHRLKESKSNLFQFQCL